MKRLVFWILLATVLMTACDAPLSAPGLALQTSDDKEAASEMDFLNSESAAKVSTGSKTGSCWATSRESLTAYEESSSTTEVSGTVDAGLTILILGRTQDGWLGFDLADEQAIGQGRERLHWYHPNWSSLIFEPPGCESELPYLPSYDSLATSTYNAPVTTGTPPHPDAQPKQETSGANEAPVILLLTDQGKGHLGDIYAWDVATQTLKQLTSWGYNFAPSVSPDGQWLAYRSVSQAAVGAMTQEQATFVEHLANIWLLNPYTEEAIRIAEQPQDAAYGSGKLISRYDPLWAPDGSFVAWFEGAEGDPDPKQIAIYTLSSKSTTTFPVNLSPCCPGWPVLYLGHSGLAVVNREGTPPDTEEVIYLFDTQGQQLARLTSSFFPEYGWITDSSNREYLGGIVNGVLTVIDPLGSTQPITIQGYAELYNPMAPDGLSAYSMGVPGQWAIARQGRHIADINTVRDISIAPDGQAIVYRYNEEEMLLQGGLLSVYLIEGQTVPISPQLRMLAATWGATAWRTHPQ